MIIFSSCQSMYYPVIHDVQSFTIRMYYGSPNSYFDSFGTVRILCAPWHRWELPVLRYHGIRVNYPYPFLGVIFMVILHDFIIKLPLKIVKPLPFSPLYGKLSYFSFHCQILCFQKIYTKLYLSLNITRTIYQKHVTFCNFRNRSSHRNNCFWFLDLITLLYHHVH